jgi:hypothetical protein
MVCKRGAGAWGPMTSISRMDRYGWLQMVPRLQGNIDLNEDEDRYQ